MKREALDINVISWEREK